MSQGEEPKAELIIGGDEWEHFLFTLETFMTLHQRTLQTLKELVDRNRSLMQELRDAINLSKVKEEPAGSIALQASIDRGYSENRMNRPFKRAESAVQQHIKAALMFLGRFSRIKHFASSLTPKTRNLAGSLASCEKCGYQIKRASRYCEGCGGDFSALTCPCGRELNVSDKFCDRCGRTI